MIGVDVDEAMLERVWWRGLPFQLGTTARIVEYLASLALTRNGGLIVTANASILRGLSSNDAGFRFRRDVRAAVVDGWPVATMLSRDLRKPRPARVTGSDLIDRVTEASRSQRFAVAIAASEGSRAAAELGDRYKGSTPIGIDLDAYVHPGDGTGARIAAKLPQGPCILFLCLGFPKQELIGSEVLKHRPDVVVIGAGAAADFVTGAKRRAPRVFQAAHMEWFWRLASEPRRLAKRYLAYDLPFVVRSLAMPRHLGRRLRAVHYGPGVSTAGGMGTVIRELTSGQHTGAFEFEAVETWVARAPLGSIPLALGRTALSFRRGKPTVAHIHISERGSLIREGIIAFGLRLLRVPVFVSLHGAKLESDLARSVATRCVLRAVLRWGCRTAFVLGPRTRDALREMGVTIPILVVPNPVDTRRLGQIAERSLANGERTPSVIFAGEVGCRKGIDRLVQAWPTIRRTCSRAKCEIYGPIGEGIPQTWPDGMTYHGVRSRDDCLEAISRSSVACLPARMEVLPMFLLESLAMGLRIVATDVGEIGRLASAPGVEIAAPDATSIAAATLRALKAANDETAALARRWAQENIDVSLVRSTFESAYNRARPHV